MLDNFLLGKVRTLVLSSILIIFSAAVSKAQMVSGTVRSSTDNQPLAGVTVHVSNSNKGTVTDNKGYYQLEDLSSGDTLVFSFVGYQAKKEVVGDQSSINVSLKLTSSSLDQLVVVGYGTQRKVNLTGSVAQVDGDVLDNRAITNISDGLQGVIANLNVTTTTSGGAPGAEKALNIRGYTGLGSESAPLILIDGVPGDINSVNPRDVASITVLKDAASSAIYGSRAPYGVILVKTKTGKQNTPLTISYDNNISFSQIMDQPTMLNSLDFVNFYNEAYKNAGAPPRFSQDVIDRVKQYIQDPKNTPTTIPDPSNPAMWMSWDGANANVDWFKVFLKDWAPSQQHNISLNGGGQTVAYYFDVGYKKENGMFKYYNDNHERLNLRSNIDVDANDWLNFSFKTFYTKGSNNSPRKASFIGNNWFHQLARRWPIIPVKDPNGHFFVESYIPHMKHGGSELESTSRLGVKGSAVITPIEGWEIKGDYNFQMTHGESLKDQWPIPYYNALNQLEFDTDIPSNLWNVISRTQYYTYNFLTSYEKNINDHYFKALVGYQREFTDFKSLSGHNTGFYNQEQPSLSLMYGTDNISTGNDLYRWGTEGVFMRFNYNYKEKYLFEFNGRYDGASLFPKSSRFSFFPSFSVGYNIAKEDYFGSLGNVVSMLKLRASYGKLGDITTLINDGNYYPYQTTLSTFDPSSGNFIFGSGRLPFVRPGSLKTDEITWAKPSMLDFGVDVSAFEQRLNFTFDWYQRKTIDLFGPARSYSAVLGANPPQRNNASIKTKGFDLSVSWNDKVGEVGYNLGFMLSNYKGVVEKYPNPANYIYDWYKGKDMGEIWGYKTKGLFQSDEEIDKSADQSKIFADWYPGDVHLVDVNGDGKVYHGDETLDDPGDLVIIGNNTPQFSYSINFGITWKGFGLNGFFQGIGKREFFSTSNYFWGIMGDQWQSSPLDINFNNRWTPETPDGYFPRYYLSDEMDKNMVKTDRYLIDGSYLRLKSLSLSYELPDGLLEAIHIPYLMIYLSAKNLFTLSPDLNKKFEVDPELLISDSKVYPLQRTFSFGINLKIR